MSKRELIVLFDGNAIFHRAYHAIPMLTTKTGLPTNAIYGFTTMLFKSLQELKPAYVVVAWDKSSQTFRKKLYPDYKANRTKLPDNLYVQVAPTKEVVQALGIPLIEVDNYEADDIIGTLAKQSSQKGLETIIVTGDKDELQLIDRHTKVCTMRRGITDTITYDEKLLLETYGLTPKQFIDYKALRGDPSDNIMGVPGIGDKTAAQLIADYGSLAGVFKHLSKLSPAVAEKLKIHHELAYLSHNLVTIVTDMNLRLNLKEAKFGRIDQVKTRQLFQKLEFRSLLAKLPGNNQGVEPNLFTANHPKSTATHRANYRLVDSAKELANLVTILKKSKNFAFDTETTGLDSITAGLVGMSFCASAGQAYYVPVGHSLGKQLTLAEVLTALKPILENPRIGKIGHNIKFDYQIMKSVGVTIAPITFDTMVAAFLLNPLRRSQSLDDLAFSELGIETIPISDLIGTGKQQISFDLTPIEKASTYAAEDADITWRLYEILRKELAQQPRLEKLASRMEWPLISVLAEMEINGIKLDINYLKKLSKTLNQRITKIKEKIWKSAGGAFNINSTKQLKEVLFIKLKIDQTSLKRGKTGTSTAAKELDKLRGLHPIIDLITQYRELTKLVSTYVDALPKLIDQQSRLHTSFNQTITQTGRLSSTNPNLQNIPVRAEFGRQIRSAFVAEKGKVLISADYSQLELRLAAVLAEDQVMIKAFNSGADVHTQTAALLYKVKPKAVTDQMRSAAKTINFGVLYGMSPHGLSIATGMDNQQAREFIDRYFEIRKGLLNYIEKLKDQAKQRGYVETVFGRIRPIPEINSSNFAIRQAAERAAVNMPIQGMAADIMKLAMIELAKKIDSETKIILQVHDELLLEVPIVKAKKTAKLLKDTMENVYHLPVHIGVEVSQGTNWGQL